MQPTTTINDRYVVSRPLGGGGMGEVFLARDRVLERDVALKVLRGQYAENEEFVERFRREALNVASLSHPNIVSVYDRGEAEDGSYYMAMEYVPGGTLKDRIDRDGPLPPATASAVAVQIAGALGAAHERGVIHRDVKPQNVLVSASGDAKVADFGIARAAAADVISGTSTVLGTARYMSPEQAMGEVVGPTSDLYSLGVVLYEMLTGEAPFEADTPVAVSMKQVNEPPRPPKEIRGEVPEGLNAVVLKLLAKDPAARYASAAALIAELDRLAAGGAPSGASAGVTAGGTTNETRTEPLLPAPAGGSRHRRRRRRRLARYVAALALLTLSGGLAWGLLGAPTPGEIVGALEGVPDRVPVEKVQVLGVEDLDEQAARRRLEEAGLGTAVRNRKSDEEDAGQVLEQSVPAGKKVEEGSRVLLAISSGPGPDGQRGSAPDPTPGDRPANRAEGDDPGGPGDPPNPRDYGGTPPNADAAASASAEPAPPAPASPVPSSPEPASPDPTAPPAAPPAPSSPAPASPGPSEPRVPSGSPSSSESPSDQYSTGGSY
ncbi:MAG: Serine/threonine protein kinase PrkC, regulator of stationary phase [uncultured Rubrobacteraceae bacterium]|uniref:non-specific serine/threonine protein kinase n=1 Tax=uncultured Rubrobacteraceae bacterium TaxID=349277 RepID=A0A6J4NSP8_9ACTN|nr:MAG: Serine/threonine protein kinase PrkC, regulator of stationary phase [uncultured Rubrobacteraceae bacterium]